MAKEYEVVEVLRCSHCKEHYSLDEESIKKHIANCVVNPATKSCVRCKHLIKHNIIDKDTGKPNYYYMCNKKNKIKLEYDITAIGNECFETREDKLIECVDSIKYTEYLKETVEKIQKTME